MHLAHAGAAIAGALLTAMLHAQEPQPGIARDLAAARSARVSQLTYQLRFAITADCREVQGSVVLLFHLPDNQPSEPLVLDFGGKDLTAISVNRRDAGAAVVRQHDHIVIAPSALQPGANVFSADFSSPVAPTGTPLTVYRDRDGRQYFYTLLVPADAHVLFPCFDQPDLKARFRLQLDLPADWQAVANGADTGERGDGAQGLQRRTFAETAPISTYLFAFAAGPFAVAERQLGAIDGVQDPVMRILFRAGERDRVDVETLAAMHRDGLRWLCDYFGTAYPFGKLDFVLLPGFPYGGMEHAGAIFYRETALAFDHKPTEAELSRRSTLIYHELSHQWFGNLVTMRWFDDLWLKEGFATFVSHLCMEQLEPQRRSWLRFLQRVKPRAYEVDGSPGTTPVFQELLNLADAKSAYGAIVYNKAPAVLRELHERLGAAAFRRGLQRFLAQHAFGAADWRDLARALENASRQDLSAWSQAWLLSPSMPEVRVRWEIDDNGLCRAFEVQQRAIAGARTWPLRCRLLCIDAAGNRTELLVEGSDARIAVAGPVGRPAPVCVLVNRDDAAYGRFVPDPRSRDWLLANLAAEADPLLRAVAGAALLEAVRAGELDPLRFADLALALLAAEQDPETHGALLGALHDCLLRWQEPARAAAHVDRTRELLLDQLQRGRAGCELQILRFLCRMPPTDATVELCRRVAAARELPPGLRPGRSDRYLAVAALLAGGREQGELAALSAALRGEDVAKEEFLCSAAVPTAAAKQAWFERALQVDGPPEQWVIDGLGHFHWPGQDALTLPFLRPALDKVDWVKQHRRIFFMPAWLDGFVNGHGTAAALTIAREFAATTALAPDVRQKLLQSLDGLERAARLRSLWK